MSLCCVLVTYGDRAYLLEQVVNILKDEQKVTSIIIVNNCSVENSRKKIEQLQNSFPSKVRIIHLDENYGSAKGYKVGLMEAWGCEDCDFIYMLDDDNVPDENAIKVLTDVWRSTSMEEKETNLVLLSLRNDRRFFSKAAQGEKINNCFPVKNSFLGFHIFKLISKISKRMISKYHNKKKKQLLDKVVVPFAPYGGLFFHKNLLDKIGLPNEEFYLYHDDTEFTYRITRSGGKIYLVTGSVVTEIDKPWFKNDKKKLLNISYIHDGSDARVYYGVRNMVYFYYNYLNDSLLLWGLNKFVYLLILKAVAILYNRKKRYELIRKAIKDGISRKLGKNEELSSL
jgi:GT2 family glycosyltransferase